MLKKINIFISHAWREHVNISSIAKKLLFKESKIDNAENGTSEAKLAPPLLIKELTDKNIVYFKDVYFSIPHCLGPIDLQGESEEFIKTIEQASTLELLEESLFSDEINNCKQI